MKKIPDKFAVLTIYMALVLVTLLAYVHLGGNEFVDYDDPDYVTENPHVYGGITYQSIIWAFTTPHEANWNPVTQISHMLDCELFGLNPGRHHLTSLLFHIVSTLLLFWVLNKMTAGYWQSVFVAAIFALHPLHVESVAWIAERKDVLSGFFWILTIAAYLHYIKRPIVSRYILVLICLTIGLMSKPMLITLPFVLLLLDYWPLNRLRFGTIRETDLASQYEPVNKGYEKRSIQWLIVEKIPLIVNVALFSVIVYFVQHNAGALMEKLSLKDRIANAFTSYSIYLGDMFYPRGLAVFYPHPVDTLPIWKPIVSLLFLVFVTIIIIWKGITKRYLLTGWLWYIGTLIPVIGLIQTGLHARADRFTYLPSIGVYIIVAWGAFDLFAKLRHKKVTLSTLIAIILGTLVICTRKQVSYWQNDFSLFGHALEATRNNHVMHSNFGFALKSKGKQEFKPRLRASFLLLRKCL